ncbi:MAG: hypothetical protein AABY00_01095 [Nanoarchaeota archaeon]
MKCPNCKCKEVVKRGKRYNQSGAKQRFLCNKCKSIFIKKDGFERMRFTKKDIARAIHLHNDGLSLFQIQNHLWQHDGVKLTRKTISDWIKKYRVFLKSSK